LFVDFCGYYNKDSDVLELIHVRSNRAIKDCCPQTEHSELKRLCLKMFVSYFRFVTMLTLCIAIDVNYLQLLGHYCSKSLDCRPEEKVDSNLTAFENDECCGQCSCNEECGQSLSCCLKEDNIKYSETHGKECVKPFNGNVEDFQRINGLGVIMVTQCPDKNEECKYTHGTLNVNPVESPMSEVFINKDCARCNNVSDTIPWIARIVSKGTHIFSFRNMKEPNINTGTIIYEPPTPFSYPTCYGSFIPVNIANCPNELYKQMCSSTVLPFFSSYGTFQNVFCYLCTSSDVAECDLNYSRTLHGTFSLLLDNTLDTGTIVTYFSRDSLLRADNKCREGYIPHPSKVRRTQQLLVGQIESF